VVASPPCAASCTKTTYHACGCRPAHAQAALRPAIVRISDDASITVWDRLLPPTGQDLHVMTVESRLIRQGARRRAGLLTAHLD